MFNKNTYGLLQQGSTPLHSRESTSVVDLNGNEFLLHHHHHHHHHHDDIFSGHYLAAGGPVAEAAAAMYNQDVGGLINGDPSAILNNNTCPRTPKRDRHSKINTSQGPRDRRVRLSIGVARKFFDLQEMLGFDKPSKTLDWLLTKSKTAIKDLVHTKQNAGGGGGACSDPCDECEVENEEVLEDGMHLLGADSKGKSVMLMSANNKHKGGGASKDPQMALAKESRVKARARARERTREKLCIKQHLNNDLNNPSIPIQYMNNQLQVCKISSGGSSGSRLPMVHCHGYEEAAASGGDLIQESCINVMKRKVKNNISSSILGFQPNFILSSRDHLSSNYGIPSPYSNAAENWDMVSSFTSQSNMLDHQHKFNQ